MLGMSARRAGVSKLDTCSPDLSRDRLLATMPYMVAGGAENTMSQMRRGAIEYCVLALLRDRERYGFELAGLLADADGLLTSEGTLYPLLARLRKVGLVETSWRESNQGPPRRYYRLTEDGARALETFYLQWKKFRDAVDSLLDGGLH